MVRWYARRAVAQVLHVLLAVLPTRRHVFVSSWPSKEGNGIETVRALLERYDGAVVWADAPDEALLGKVGLSAHAVARPAKNSAAALWSFLTAEASFFTHGLYGCPRPARRKPMVNLWHGDGPKAVTGAKVPSTYFVSGSKVFGEYRARQFDVTPADLILTGLPRLAQLFDPATDAALAALGIDPSRPFVLWMPTYRRASGSGLNGSWADVADASSDLGLAGAVEPGLRALGALGVQVVVKPHPLDVASRKVGGVRLLDDDDLDRAGVTLYGLLARAGGLVTDYSSVWTEFLALDRPIGFYAPDLHEYVVGRGLYPVDAMDHLPGPLLVTAQDFAAWGRAVLGDDAGAGARAREAARVYFGMVDERRPAYALLDELGRRGALRLRG